MTIKFDAGKWRLSLIPVSCLRAIAGVLEYGAAKYTHQILPDTDILGDQLCEKLVNVLDVPAKNLSLRKNFAPTATGKHPCTWPNVKAAENCALSNLSNNSVELVTKEIVSAEELKNQLLNVNTSVITEKTPLFAAERKKESSYDEKIRLTEKGNNETLFLGTWLSTEYLKKNTTVFWQKVVTSAEAKSARTWTTTIQLENSAVCFVVNATKDSDCFRMILVLCEMLWNISLSIDDFNITVSGADNWKTLPNASRRYYDAAIRHLTAWWDGERNDPESQLPHLAHAACCVIFLLWLDDNPQKPESPDNADQS